MRSRSLHAQRNFACFRLPDSTATGRLAGVGGDRVGVRVAAPAVADLCQEGRGADHRVGLEEAAEDLPVGVRVQRLADLGLEPVDLLDENLEGADQAR